MLLIRSLPTESTIASLSLLHGFVIEGVNLSWKFPFSIRFAHPLAAFQLTMLVEIRRIDAYYLLTIYFFNQGHFEAWHGKVRKLIMYVSVSSQFCQKVP